MHGGISDRLRSLQQLRELRRPMLDFDARNPTIELDLLWADPELGVRGCLPSTRGASVMFGDDLIVSMCQRLDIDLIVRAHQVRGGANESVFFDKFLPDQKEFVIKILIF